MWDLDLHHPHLPFPCTLQQYVDHALQTGAVQLPQQFQRWVPGLYCQEFTVKVAPPGMYCHQVKAGRGMQGSCQKLPSLRHTVVFGQGNAVGSYRCYQSASMSTRQALVCGGCQSLCHQSDSIVFQTIATDHSHTRLPGVAWCSPPTIQDSNNPLPLLCCAPAGCSDWSLHPPSCSTLPQTAATCDDLMAHGVLSLRLTHASLQQMAAP